MDDDLEAPTKCPRLEASWLSTQHFLDRQMSQAVHLALFECRSFGRPTPFFCQSLGLCLIIVFIIVLSLSASLPSFTGGGWLRL